MDSFTFSIQTKYYPTQLPLSRYMPTTLISARLPHAPRKQEKSEIKLKTRYIALDYFL